MEIRNMDVIKLNPHHITDIAELKINNENCTTLSRVSNVVYVSKDGSDSDGNGSQGNPFLTIEYANNYAIANKPAWPGRGVVKVSPGIYTEHLTQSHYRIYIVGGTRTPDEKELDVTIRNLGDCPENYPLGTTHGLNLIGINVTTSDTDNEFIEGIAGELMSSSTFSYCNFMSNYFVEQVNPRSLYMQFTFCHFQYGKAFDLSGTIDYHRGLSFGNCTIEGEAVFSSSGDGTKEIKLANSFITDEVNISGDWSLLMQHSEMHTNAEIIFDTDGFVDIFSSIIINGIHFITDTPQTKKLVNCLFRDIPEGQGDVTADVSVAFIEYSGNHQCNGIDGEIITVSKIKNVGGGQNVYRNIHEALRGSTLQDTIINLEGDVDVEIPLTIPPNVDIQIDGNSKWSLHSTATANLAELGNNQKLSFVNMRRITGGKKAIVNGDGATLNFISCGRVTDINYVNVEMNAGNSSSSVGIVNTSLQGTGAPAIKITDVDVACNIDKSFIKGASGYAAIEWTVDASNKFRGKYTTIIHGSLTGVSPLLNSVPSPGADIDISLYNSAINHPFPTADFTNNVKAQPNISVDPDIDY